MLTDEMKAQGWVEHDGGPCPVGANSRLAAVMFADGVICSKGYRAKSIGWSWGRLPHGLRIIAYKVEQPNG